MNAGAEKVRSIFLAAVENHAPDQWEAYLDEACAGDQELRRRVEVLLCVHAQPNSLLDGPNPALVATIDEPPTREGPGTVLGPYKLLQQIGEGGMGTVFMAEQTQPVQRKVALKVIKAGMDSRQVIARFEAERQALALMDHVNIAHVLDAGATESGLPYFVMELVHGVPITQYCDDHRLTPRQRLELFVPVCQAIQHAHTKGIIHRDIKPSNVMITLYDGKPVPKVIDFGVAKATEQKLTERTLFTQYGTVIGTFEYMSPEQAELSALGVDTRSDIYSLGVLLYELLTGSTPLNSKRLKEAAYSEILRMIKEEEPPRPSTRLSDSGETLASISAQRHMEPAKLVKLVRGELDWIVMKCLEKDRNRRYETANGLARDVQRYLKDEPVEACPPSAWYRFRKFARRRLAALVMAALGAVAVLALVGLAVGLWYSQELQRAYQSEAKARAEAEEARREVQAAYEQLEYAQYLHKVGLAHLDWREANVGRMQQLLQECPAPRRGWEWHYLHRLCHTDLLTLRGHAAGVTSVAFSPDGRTLASGDASPHGTVRLWDAATGRPLATLTGHRDAVVGVAFSPDGQRLASAGGDGVKVWDIATCKELHTFRGHKALVRAVAFSPDGRSVASTGHDAVVRVWDAATGEQRCALQGHKGHVHGVAFSPDGKRLASAGLDEIVRVWDVELGHEVFPLKGHTSQIQAVAFSPDGTRLASASWDRTIRVWDVTTGEVAHTLKGHTNTVGGVAFSPDGQRLASAGADCTVRVWDTWTGEPLLVFKGHSGAVRGVAFSPDGQRLASAGGDHTVKVWDATRSQDARTFRQPGGDIWAVAFSPDGKRLASAGRDRDGGNVLLWDAATGRAVRRLPGDTSAIWGVTFRPDGLQLASAGEDGAVRVWDIGPGQADGANPRVRTLAGSRRRIYGVAFVPDGTRLAAAGDDGIVRVWDVTTGEVVCTHQGHRKTVLAVAVSPDGRRVASAGDEHTVRVWDAVTGQEALLLKGHNTVVHALAFSPDGSRLALACHDSTVRLWDATTGQEVLTLRGHTSTATSVAFSPDGKRLASAGWDQTVKVWDVATGQGTLTLIGHNHMVCSVAFSPDGTQLASASADGTVKIWDATPMQRKADSQTVNPTE